MQYILSDINKKENSNNDHLPITQNIWELFQNSQIFYFVEPLTMPPINDFLKIIAIIAGGTIANNPHVAVCPYFIISFVEYALGFP